jgi:hypothetical protein
MEKESNLTLSSEVAKSRDSRSNAELQKEVRNALVFAQLKVENASAL